MNPSSSRIAALDRLRGLVIILMALDHCRGFVVPSGLSPENLETTTLGFFLVRWVTHLCAPTFLFLAGTSAFLVGERDADPWATTTWLVKRGAWLMFLEATWVNFMWFFAFERIHLGVLWAIGGAMLGLACLVVLRLSPRMIGGLGALGLLVTALWPVPSGGLVGFFFQPSWIGGFVLGLPLQSVYVIAPWLFVLALGYGLGNVMRDGSRVPVLGLVFALVFVVLRAFELPGNPTGWTLSERGWTITLVDFLSPSKYPPSLQFVLMGLAPSLLAFPLLARARGLIGENLELFGQVAMFFYLAHIPVYHLVGKLQAQLRFGASSTPGDSQLSYLWLLGCWLAVLLVLRPLLRRWRDLKRARRDLWLLRYL